MKNTLFIVLTILLFVETKSQNLWTSSRPDGHAPIGVMGDHTHNKGEWMISYRFMQMKMSGLLMGTTHMTQSEAHVDYMMVPDNMSMSMHMIGAMYAISDRITLMTMLPYVQKNMDIHMRSAPEGMNFSTSSQSFGDISVSSLIKLLDNNSQRIHVNLGLSIPVGSIDEKDVTPMYYPMETQLPYPMQIGSGSYELIPGITYLSQPNKWSFGSQISSRVRLNENDNQYKFGNLIRIDGWTAFKISEWLSGSARLAYSNIGQIKGQGPQYMNPVMAPTLKPENYGGNDLSAALGANIYFRSGLIKGWRLGTEYVIHVYQNLNGLQMKRNHTIIVGLQYAF